MSAVPLPLLANRKEPEIFESPDLTDDKPEDKKGAAPDPRMLAADNEKKNDDLIIRELKPQLAFEQFAGRVFDTSKINFADADVVSGKHFQILSNQQSEFQALRARERVFESPLERFTRLKDEAAQLTKDLQMMSDAQKKESAAGALSSALTRELTSLEKDLAQLSSNPNFQPFLAQNINDKTYLEQKLLLDRLMTEMQKNANAPQDDSKKASGGGSVTYELYYNAQKDATRQQVNVVDLDRRIGNVEKAIGNLNDDKTLGYPDLNTALQSLRRKLEFLDQARLDAIYRRIKTLISELDILQGAKDKSQSAGQIQPNIEKINQLFDIITRWDETAQSLPAVVSRLQSLRDLHEECAAAVVKVQTIDTQHTAAMNLLQQDKEALAKVEYTLAQNLKVMQGNVSTLEARFTALAAKLDKLK